MKHNVFIGLGSNQGEKVIQCERAITEILKVNETSLLAKSSWYKSEPWGKEDQDWFVNGVIQLIVSLPPHDLLRKYKDIERALGRQTNGQWEPRIIDIDILFYDHLVTTSPDLQIPHPLIHLRNFVLVPMAEIAPHFIHPVFQKDMRKLLEAGEDHKKVIRVTG